ncbi:Tripartite tricarboxylate transporter family receptor [compost metagenome]
MGPAGLAPAVVAQLNKAVNAALETPELRSTLTKLGVEPLTTTPEGVQARIQSESTRWSAVIKTAGIQLDQ